MKSSNELEALYPDASDRLVRWNIRSDQGQDGIELWERIYGETLDADPFRYLGTAEWIDEELCEEIDCVKADLCEVVQSYLTSRPEFNAVALDLDSVAYRGEVMSLLSPIDRTLEIPVIDPGIFTVQLYHQLKQRFFPTWPQWRLHVVGTASDGEESLMIYENVVRVGHVSCPPDDLDVALTGWSRAVSEIRERRLGPARRQWNHIKDRVPDILPQISESDPVILVGAFDNWEGDFSCCNLWFLQLFECTLLADDVPDDVGWTATHCLDRRGMPMAYDPFLTPYELVQCTIPKNRELYVNLKEIEGNRVWAFRLESDQIIADEDLSV